MNPSGMSFTNDSKIHAPKLDDLKHHNQTDNSDASTKSQVSLQLNVENLEQPDIHVRAKDVYGWKPNGWPKEFDHLELKHARGTDQKDQVGATFLYDNESNVCRSLWKEIPYKTQHGLYYYVNEIPRGTKPKMEMIKESPINHIQQDRLSDGTPRSYFKEFEWNYGFIPQTIELPKQHTNLSSEYGKILQRLGVQALVGDNDPIDVVLLDSSVHPVGSILTIKVIGALLLIDKNEIDWKVLAVSTADQSTHEIIKSDKPLEIPSVKSEIREIIHFFKIYKTYENKPENVFANSDLPLCADDAILVIEDCHAAFIRMDIPYPTRDH